MSFSVGQRDLFIFHLFLSIYNFKRVSEKLLKSVAYFFCEKNICKIHFLKKIKNNFLLFTKQDTCSQINLWKTEKQRRESWRKVYNKLLSLPVSSPWSSIMSLRRLVPSVGLEMMRKRGKNLLDRCAAALFKPWGRHLMFGVNWTEQMFSSSGWRADQREQQKVTAVSSLSHWWDQFDDD